VGLADAARALLNARRSSNCIVYVAPFSLPSLEVLLTGEMNENATSRPKSLRWCGNPSCSPR